MEALRKEFALKPEEKRKTIVKFVSEVYKQKTCVRCAIRFLCVHNIQLFNLSEADIVQFYHSLPETTQDLHFRSIPKRQKSMYIMFRHLTRFRRREKTKISISNIEQFK